MKNSVFDKSSVNKQDIQKLNEISLFDKDVAVNNGWTKVSKENDPKLWNFLTDVEASIRDKDLTDTDKDANEYKSEKGFNCNPFPIVPNELTGHKISRNESNNSFLHNRTWLESSFIS